MRTRGAVTCPIVVLAAGASLLLAPLALAATVSGTAGDDLLRGTSGADVIEAAAGNDTVMAGAGADQVRGGPGRDLLDLGPGDDWADATQGRDFVFGGDGADTVIAPWYAELGRGDDLLLAGKGACLLLQLGPGDDVSRGNRGWGGVDGCTVDGGPGADRILWGGTDAPDRGESSVLKGGDGPDILRGGYNADHLIGGRGDDRLIPEEANGPDQVEGGAGDDVVVLNPSEGTRGFDVRCGPGQDTVLQAEPGRTYPGCETLILEADQDPKAG